MRVGLVYNSFISNVCVCLDSSLVLFTGVLCSRFEAFDFKESAEFALFSVKMLSDQGLCPGPRGGLRPQTPIIGSRSRARHILSVPAPFLLGNEHWVHKMCSIVKRIYNVHM